MTTEAKKVLRRSGPTRSVRYLYCFPPEESILGSDSDGAQIIFTVFNVKDWSAVDSFKVTYSLDVDKFACTCPRWKLSTSRTCQHVHLAKKFQEGLGDHSIAVGIGSDKKVRIRTLYFYKGEYAEDGKHVKAETVHELVTNTKSISYKVGTSRVFTENDAEIEALGDISIADLQAVAEVRRSLQESLTKRLHLSKVGSELLAHPTSSKKATRPKIKRKIKPKATTSPKVKETWKDFPRPDSNLFYISDSVWTQCLYAVHHGKNILIVGPAGSGKTQVTYELAKAVSYNHVAFNMGAMSEARSALIGNAHFSKDKGTWFEESRFVKAVRGSGEGKSVILLDELTRADRAAFNILLPLLDQQGYLALDESEEGSVVIKDSSTCFIATANVGMEYTGTDAMDKALKERFAVTIDLTFPPKGKEVNILIFRAGVEPKDASRLVDIADKQRALARDDGEFIEMISTRMLLAAAEQLAAGIEFKDACEYCIATQFSNEGGETSDRAKVKQIIQKGGTTVIDDDTPF